MKDSTDRSTSISEANPNFSKLTRLADEKEEGASDYEVEKVANKILSKHLKVFEELAKGKTDE